LVVEDEPLVSLHLKMLLDEDGYGVVGPYRSVAETLTKLPELVIAAAVLDVNLGGEQVFPVAERLSKAGIPFVFLSGQSKDVFPQRYQARPYLSKPFTSESFLAAIRGMLMLDVTPEPPHGTPLTAVGSGT